MKRIFILLSMATLVLSGCSYWDHAIADLDDRLTIIENTLITNITEQIMKVQLSLVDLEAVDSNLSGLISALEDVASDLQKQIADGRTDCKGQFEAIDKAIKELKQKDIDIKAEIDGLKAYIEKEISKTTEWADATFATLEQYLDIQKELSEINVSIGQLREDINDEIEKMDQKIADSSTALTASIAAAEEGMKQWVSKTLQESYYTIAQTDALIEAMKTRLQETEMTLHEKDKALEETDQDLQARVDAADKALEQAEKDLKQAYEAAIKTAIDENNGIITGEIATAVSKAQGVLEGKIELLDTEIADIDNRLTLLQEQVDNLEDRLDNIEGNVISSISEQLANIELSIKDLEDVDITLDDYIESLQTTAADLQKQIDAGQTDLAAKHKAINDALEALKEKDGQLSGTISDLKNYADDQLSESKDWVSSTFATLGHHSELQGKLSEITVTVNQLITDIESDLSGLKQELIAKINEESATLTTAIMTADASIRQWVSKTLQDSYYTIAQTDALLNTLKEGLTASDKTLEEEIETLEQALDKAKTDLKQAYEAAIETAINDNHGVIQGEIATAVSDAKTELQGKIDNLNTEITNIKTRIGTLEGRVDNLVARIQSMRYMPLYSDRCVAFGMKTKTAVLDFMVSPAEAAAEIQNRWGSDNTVVKASLIYTLTRASVTPVPLSVVRVEGDASGLLSVTVKEDTPLSDLFWNGGQDAMVYLNLNDGNNDLQSELISTKYTGFEIIEEEGASPKYYSRTLEGLLKWAYDVNVLDRKDADFVLEEDVELPMFEIRQNDAAQTYTYTNTPITIDANGTPSGSNWQSICTGITAVSDSYSGHVDGQKHTIRGLRIVHNNDQVGFIGALQDDASAKNIVFEDAIIIGNGEVGVVGRSQNGGIIENIELKGSNIKGTTNVGGIAGRLYRRKGGPSNYNEALAYIRNCTTDSNTTIDGTGSYVGGICGKNYGAIIISCINNADVTGDDNVGGVAGRSRSYYNNGVNGYVVASASTDEATISSTSSSGCAGGVVGDLFLDVTHKNAGSQSYIIACYSTSTISSSFPGTIVGRGYHNYIGQIIASWAKKEDESAKLVGVNQTAFITSSDHYLNPSEITQNIIDEMNNAIVDYNNGTADYIQTQVEQTCPYVWTWTSGEWPTLTLVNP